MTMIKDLHDNILIKKVLAPLVSTGTVARVGAIIDNQGYSSLEYVIELGTITKTTSTYTLLLEDGNDSALSDNATVGSSQLLGTLAAFGFAGTNGGEVRKIGYVGPKRYTRLTITPVLNGSGSTPIAAIAILGHPHIAPVTQSAS